MKICKLRRKKHILCKPFAIRLRVVNRIKVAKMQKGDAKRHPFRVTIGYSISLLGSKISAMSLAPSLKAYVNIASSA